MLTTSLLTLTTADIALLYTEKDKKLEKQPRAEQRINRFASVLPTSYALEVRVTIARWFLGITDTNGSRRHTLAKLKAVAQSIGLTPAKKRDEVENQLLLHPGL
jgi:hypothetical protein